MTETYPLFREYSLEVKKWLTNLFDIPRFSKEFVILSITTKGTTDGGVNQCEITVSENMNTVPQTQQIKVGHPIKLYGTLTAAGLSNDDIYIVTKVSQSGTVLILDPAYKKPKLEQKIVGGKLKRSINIVYGNFDRSLATVVSPLRNGTIDSPSVLFYLTDYQYKLENSRPKESYYTRHYVDASSGAITGAAAVPPLQVYEIRYTVNIWAVFQQELDIMNYQITTEFAPEKYFWIPGKNAGDDQYGQNFQGNRLDREFKGQWAHALIEGLVDASDMEPGDATNRTLRSEATFVITNAYTPLPFDNKQSMISALNVELEAAINQQSRAP